MPFIPRTFGWSHFALVVCAITAASTAGCRSNKQPPPERLLEPLGKLCEASLITAHAEPPTTELRATTPTQKGKHLLHVDVTADGLWIDGVAQDGMSTETFRSAQNLLFDRTEELQPFSPEPEAAFEGKRPGFWLVAESGVAASRVAQVLGLLDDAGIRAGYLVLGAKPTISTQVPRPELREELEQLSGDASDADARIEWVEKKLSPMVELCPGLGRVLGETAAATEEHRCNTMHTILESELGDCPANLDRDELDTLILTLAGARSNALEVVAFPVVLDEEGVATSAPSGTWADWATSLLTDLEVRRLAIAR